METKTIAYRNSAVTYNVTGKGNPVLLLHGFGEDSTIWDNQIGLLEKYFYLIIPDIPGSGQSPAIENANIETYAEIVKLILDSELEKLPLQRAEGVSMIGHSMGGYITLAFAEKYPQYLKSFGLFHSSAFADNEEKKATRKKAIEFIKDNGAYNFLKTSLPGLFKPGVDEKLIELLVEKGRNFSTEALIQYYEAMIMRPDRTHILKSFPKPILFIIGEFDNAIPLESSLQQCYLPIISQVHILKNSGHMAMLEETEKTNAILLDFLLSID